MFDGLAPSDPLGFEPKQFPPVSLLRVRTVVPTSKRAENAINETQSWKPVTCASSYGCADHLSRKIVAFKPARVIKHRDLATPTPRRCKRATAPKGAANDLAVAFKTQVQEWKNTLLRGKDPEALKKHWTGFKKLEREMG